MYTGPPEKLQLMRPPSRMWAGNQPFLVQPQLALVDAGGNIIKEDSSTIVNAFIVPSLAQNSNIIIDTSQDPVPRIVSVIFSADTIEDAETMYSPGELIRIVVIFSQNVYVSLSPEFNGSIPTVPTLELNIIDNTIILSYVKAHLIERSMGQLSRRLEFEFTVRKGHNQFPINYRNITSLRTNDFMFTDGHNRTVLATLPGINIGEDLVDSKEIGVSSDPAAIRNISSFIPPGEYGAGHEIGFEVEFSRTVRKIFIEYWSHPFSCRFLRIFFDS